MAEQHPVRTNVEVEGTLWLTFRRACKRKQLSAAAGVRALIREGLGTLTAADRTPGAQCTRINIVIDRHTWQGFRADCAWRMMTTSEGVTALIRRTLEQGPPCPAERTR
jgi:hypothetical protein